MYVILRTFNFLVLRANHHFLPLVYFNLTLEIVNLVISSSEQKECCLFVVQKQKNQVICVKINQLVWVLGIHLIELLVIVNFVINCYFAEQNELVYLVLNKKNKRLV